MNSSAFYWLCSFLIIVDGRWYNSKLPLVVTMDTLVSLRQVHGKDRLITAISTLNVSRVFYPGFQNWLSKI